MRRLLALSAALLALCAPALPAQETVSFKMFPPASPPRLADVFKLKVEASYPAKYELALDTASFDGQDFGLAGLAAAKPAGGGDTRTRAFELRVQAFTLGVSTFPELSWKLTGAGAPEEARSPSFQIEIKPAFKTGQNEGIRDIYPPFKYIPWLWLLAGAVLLAAAVRALLRLLSRRAAAAALAWRDPRSPYARAADRLKAVSASGLLPAGKIKEYYIGLTSVLRLYLQEEFSIEADTMTTSDLARELKRTGAPLDSTLQAREFLQKADLVKFARLKPEEAGRDSERLKDILAAFNAAAEKARTPAEPPAGGKP